jgi:hypothetical protein
MDKEIAGLPKRGKRPGFSNQKVELGFLRMILTMTIICDETQITSSFANWVLSEVRGKYLLIERGCRYERD